MQMWQSVKEYVVYSVGYGFNSLHNWVFFNWQWCHTFFSVSYLSLTMNFIENVPRKRENKIKKAGNGRFNSTLLNQIWNSKWSWVISGQRNFNLLERTLFWSKKWRQDSERVSAFTQQVSPSVGLWLGHMSLKNDTSSNSSKRNCND